MFSKSILKLKRSLHEGEARLKNMCLAKEYPDKAITSCCIVLTIACDTGVFRET